MRVICAQHDAVVVHDDIYGGVASDSAPHSVSLVRPVRLEVRNGALVPVLALPPGEQLVGWCFGDGHSVGTMHMVTARDDDVAAQDPDAIWRI